MLLLASTSDLLRLTLSQAINTDVHASWVDVSGSTTTPGRTNTPLSSAATSTVVTSPASSTYRTVKTLTVRNRDAAATQDVTVIHTDGTNAMELIKVSLLAGQTLHYDEHAGFTVKDTNGSISSIQNTRAVSVAALNTVVLGSDVTNNNASANTIADVTGLSFSVTGGAGEIYWFNFIIPYTSAATTTGSRWTVNGPAAPTLLNYTSKYCLTATSETVNYATAYDIPAAANASSLTAGNVAIIEGIIKPSGAGTVIARFASEVSSSAVVAKAGALLKWMRLA